jgi:hypothetical protein
MGNFEKICGFKVPHFGGFRGHKLIQTERDPIAVYIENSIHAGGLMSNSTESRFTSALQSRFGLTL